VLTGGFNIRKSIVNHHAIAPSTFGQCLHLVAKLKVEARQHGSCAVRVHREHHVEQHPFATRTQINALTVGCVLSFTLQTDEACCD
jgi:hypothetical protein